MKLKNSGSISDTEQLNFSEEDEKEETEKLELTKLEDVTKVTIFSTSPPTSPKIPKSLNYSDPANHDKIYYDDRYKESIFDPLLAGISLPKIFISIGGMLLTGFFLNTILVSLSLNM